MSQQDSKLIRLSEYAEIPLKEIEGKIHKQGINIIKRLNQRHNANLFQLTHDSIKATQYVGFVKIRDYTIQVIPKIFRDSDADNLHFLLQLLKYTQKIRIKEQDLGRLNKIEDDFFEVLIYLFAENLYDLLRRDFMKTYVSREENVSFLKGKLMLKEQIRRNSIDNTRYFCKYEEFTENNLMNQIFKYTTSILMHVSSSIANKKLLENILIHLCDVDYRVISHSDFSKIHFTRLNKQYEPLVNLCKLILENSSVQFHAAKLETFMFMFDMNKLFEEFVFEFIKQNKDRILIDESYRIVSVKDQFPIGKLFNEFRLIGDILIQDESGRKILIDTKYKILSDDLLHSGLAQSDFYQMFAYSVSQQEKYKDIVLLYPLSEGQNFPKKALNHKIDQTPPIQVHIKSINLTKIFDKDKQRIRESDMILELNHALSLF